MFDFTSDEYVRRVYAGVLGKIIGVYLGRPFEGMRYRDVLKQLGPINYYVHEQRKHPLIVTDDDISGTFTFVRALEDHPSAGKDLTPQHVAQTWLNYVIENKTIFWWGGLGLSTEHTAFLRLKNGIPAPQSGSIALNSKVVAEQIGSQIFIDGWAMVAPGNPQLAGDLARKAASVSHDGEAIYGAQVIAAMESLAFVENDLNVLLDVATRLIPADSLIYRMIADLRAFHTRHPDDWERAMVEVLEATYGYDKYGGNCHIIPNHGIIILALLYGQDNFQRTQMIANTCGWDTDCNAGNVGCLMGIKNGLAGIDAGPDWRGPVADRLMIPTADGGECMTDAVRETYRLVNVGRALNGLAPLAPKNGSRFHFSLAGSVQGFREEASVESKGTTSVSNRDGQLAISFSRLALGRTARIATATFAPIGEKGETYNLMASPTLYTGQTVRATLRGDVISGLSVSVRLYARYYGEQDKPERIVGPAVSLQSGADTALTWTVPTTNGRPIFEVGLEIAGDNGASGTIHLDHLSWDGAADVSLGIPNAPGDMSRRQWVDGLDAFRNVYDGKDDKQVFMAINNRGRGLAIYGTRDWANYSVSTVLTAHLAQAIGLAARCRGLRRYYALLLRQPNRAALIKMYDNEQILAETDFAWRCNDDPHAFALTVVGDRIIGSIDGKTLFSVTDPSPIPSGGIALVIDDGRMASGVVNVRPA